MTNLEWAIQQTVHEKRGAAKRLADAIGTSHQVLLNKVNPEVVNNHLTVREAVSLMQHTGCVLILEEVASELGYSVIKDNAAAVPLAEAVLKVMKEHGDVGGAIAAAGKHINQNEARSICKEISEARLALDALEASVQFEALGDQ